MKEQFLYRYFVLITLLFSLSVRGQNGPYAGEIRKISTLIQNTKSDVYKYSLSADYPNGQRNKLNGTNYLASDDKLMYNSNELFTMIYNDKWFYKADHKAKTVTILNLSKHLSKDYKAAMEKEMFSGSTLRYYLDSIVLRFATVKKLSKTDDSVNLELAFPLRAPIRSMKMTYSERDAVLIRYTIETFQKWPTNEFGKDKGIKQVVVCNDFKKIKNTGEYSPTSYFTIKNNVAVLKKYKKYTLYSKI